MKSISLRRFRETIAEITEKVAVVRRDPESGNYRILGVWTPADATLSFGDIEPPTETPGRDDASDGPG